MLIGKAVIDRNIRPHNKSCKPIRFSFIMQIIDRSIEVLFVILLFLCNRHLSTFKLYRMYDLVSDDLIRIRIPAIYDLYIAICICGNKAMARGSIA